MIIKGLQHGDIRSEEESRQIFSPSEGFYWESSQDPFETPYSIGYVTYLFIYFYLLGVYNHILQLLMERKASSSSQTPLVISRVTQTNMIYIVGIPKHIADSRLLASYPFCGQYGNVLKVVIKETFGHKSETFCSYITFSTDESAALAILALKDFYLQQNKISASYGTTKYCSAFLRYGLCRKQQCLYHHKIERQKQIHEDDNKKIFNDQQKLATDYLQRHLDQIDFEPYCTNPVFPSKLKVRQLLIDEHILQLKPARHTSQNEMSENSTQISEELSDVSSENILNQNLLANKIRKANSRKKSFFSFVPNTLPIEYSRVSESLQNYVRELIS